MIDTTHLSSTGAAQAVPLLLHFYLLPGTSRFFQTLLSKGMVVLMSKESAFMRPFFRLLVYLKVVGILVNGNIFLGIRQCGSFTSTG